MILGLSFLFLININKVNATSEIDQIRKKYNLVQISKDDLPKGIVPIKLNSEQELSEYFEEQNKILKNSMIFMDNISKLNLYDLRSNITFKSSNNLRNSQIVMSANIPIFMKINLIADIDYYSKGSFSSIEQINFSKMSLTGYTISNSLTNVSTSHKLYNDGSIFVSGTANYNTYILLQNTFNIDTSLIVMKYNYEFGKGFSNKVLTKNGKNILP